jgi:aminomethyltransferase
MQPDLAREYEAARSATVLIDRSHDGRVRLAGRDRLDLLHRMSTNDLTGMRPGEARPTVLTTAIARIIDLVWVLSYPDEAVMLTSPGQAETVRRWLGRHVFFQDEVTLTDVSAATGQLGLLGPGAASVADAIVPGAVSLASGWFITLADVTALRAPSLAGDGYTLLAPAERIESLRAQAQAAGAVAASEDLYQVLRVEAGQPYTGLELTEGFIPLEANLWHAVSFTKGCYIGQEIIARMESRGRLAKTLVGLRLDGEVPPGASVRQGGAVLGMVTSTVVSPRNGPIALAFVKPDLCSPGTRVEVNGVGAVVAEFPLN